MNNPGIDLALWERLRSKWAQLQMAGHILEIEFRLIASPEDTENILTIDVIQKIDNSVIVETVEKEKDEVYTILGIKGFSLEDIFQKYKEIMRQLHRQTVLQESTLVITMSPTSLKSGEIGGLVEIRDSGTKTAVATNYQHYYILNALREKMLEITGDGWTKVKAVYCYGELEFHFEY